MGVKEIIESVDPSPVFETVRRDAPPDCQEAAFHLPREYDVAVVCSMPGFWSYPGNNAVSHHAFDIYTNGYLSKKPLIMAGFGCYLTYKRFPVEVNIERRDYVVPAFLRMLKGCSAAYSRERTGATLFGVPWHPCPSVFAGMLLACPRDLDLCNFMPRGAHYPWMDPREADRMDETAPKLARYLQERGFKFMAHCPEEFDYAIMLGWAEDDVILFHGDQWKSRAEESKAAQEFLSYYARARSYIGNRIHGGIVARSFGAKVLCIGYDTRLRAVEDIGGVICTPKTFRPQLFRNWLADKPLFPPMAQWFRDQQAIFKKVMAEA
jgi:hypothetical protein